MRIHQMHFGLIPGDAISTHVLEMDRRLRAWGFETTVFAQDSAPQLAHHARPDREYLAFSQTPDDLLIYHYGIYSPSVRYLQTTRNRRILVYHNVTPAHYYEGWDRKEELLCDVARRTLPTLTECDLALGDSDFNRQELIEAGFPQHKTDVLPIFLSHSHYDASPTVDSLMAQLRGTGTVNLLTVGRVAPSKAIEDVIRIFSVYSRVINPYSRLFVVGSRYLPAYNAALDALVADLGLEDTVLFTDLVSDAELKTYYQAADLYLQASHHEGFCVPLLEAMHFGVPILARKAAAVPETLGNAGALFTRLGYEEVAEMAHLLVTDEALRTQIIARQQERLRDFEPSRVEAKLHAILMRLEIPPHSEVGTHE